MANHTLQDSVRIIHSEHDRLNAVIFGMLHFARAVGAGKPAPEPKVFRAMLLYIREYPDKIHHPKEDKYLFALLRKRTDAVNGVLDKLERQHLKDEPFLRQLEDALTYYELRGEPMRKTFVDLVESYAAFYFNHMKTEESVILPAAEQYLTPEDWDVIDAAFKENHDPLEGSGYKRGLDDLFSLIANIAPPPIGLGSGT